MDPVSSVPYRYKAPEPYHDLLDQQDRTVMSVIASYGCSQCLSITVGMVCIVPSMVAQILVPYLIGAVLDAMYQKDFDLVQDLCLQMLGVVLFSALTSMIRAYTFNRLSEEVALHIRYDLVWSILTKDVTFFDINKTGELLSRVTADTMVVENGLGTTISMLLRNLVAWN